MLSRSFRANLTTFKESPLLNQRFNKDVLWNIGSLAILGASGIMINFAIMFRQGSEALGIFNQIFAFYLVGSQIAVGGLQFSTLKHCSYEQNNLLECAKITSSALVLVAMGSLMVCAATYSLRNLIGRTLESPALALGLTFAIPGLFFFSLNKVLVMALNGLRNMRAFAVFQALRYIFILLVVVAMMRLGYTGAYLSLSLTIAEFALFIVLMLYINILLFHIRFSLSSDMWDWHRRHISFGSRGFLGGVLIEMNSRIDVFILGYFMTDRVVGIYSFGSTFAEGFAQIGTVVRQNIDPIIGKYFAEKNKEKIQEAARKIREKFYPIMSLLGVVLVMGFLILIWLVFPDKATWQSLGVLVILVTGIVIASGYLPFITLIMQGGRPGVFTLLIALTVLGNIFLNLCLIPLIGLYGAAVANASVYLFEAVGIMILAKRLFGIRL